MTKELSCQEQETGTGGATHERSYVLFAVMLTAYFLTTYLSWFLFIPSIQLILIRIINKEKN